MNLSVECKDLYTPQLILPAIDVTVSLIHQLRSSNAEKLLESVLNLVGRLTTEDRAKAIVNLLQPVWLKFLSLQVDDSIDSRQNFANAVMLLSAGLRALNEIDATEIHSLLSESIKPSLVVISSAIQRYQDSRGVVTAVCYLYKQILSAFSLKSVKFTQDEFFPVMAQSLLSILSSKNPDGLNFFVNAFSLISWEENTSKWISENFLTLHNYLSDSIKQTPDPDLISYFFDIHTKLFEKHFPISMNEIICSVIELGLYCIPLITNRNPCRSVFFYLHLVYSSSSTHGCIEKYVLSLTSGIISSLHTLNPNTFLFISGTLGALRCKNEQDFYNGAISGLSSGIYGAITQKDKERMLNCFMKAKTDPVHQMKNFVQSISNILRNMGHIDSIMATEIAIAQQQRPIRIDLTK